MMRALLGLLAAVSPVVAQAATLELDPDALPSVGQPMDLLGEPAAILHFPDGTQIPSLRAMVLVIEPGGPVPVNAIPLGETGRSFRVPADSVEEAVALAAEWKARPGVQSAFPDVVPDVEASFDDPEYGGQWYYELLEMETLWAETRGSAEVRVAVIDSGIDLDHPDLDGSWIAPFDAYDDDEDPSPPTGDDHGTAVAGIITARADNGVGIVGACSECTLIPIRMLGDDPRPVSASIAAFEHAIAQDAAVINNSWGYVSPTAVPEPLALVIERAATETRGGLGSVVIFAAGNDDRTIQDNELQALPYVLCVSATDRYGLPTNYTNEGASVDVAAPSATVTLANGGGTTVTFGGTSAAAPVVAGLAAWMISVDPSLSAEEVRELLIETSVPSPQVIPDENGHHPVYGYGEVSATALHAHFFPEETEPEPRACGCSTTSPPTGGLLALAGLWLLGRRRRLA